MSRCWSYSPDGEHRCELDAGHEESHTTYRIWTDEQSYRPDAPKSAPETLSPPPLPKPLPEPVGCIACGHKHKGRECECGCYEQIG